MFSAYEDPIGQLAKTAKTANRPGNKQNSVVYSE